MIFSVFPCILVTTETDVLGTIPTCSTLSNYISAVHNNYFSTFSSFSFSRKFMNVLTLSTEQDIEAFVTFFRSSFPDATFLTKMYNLEKHVVPFLKIRHFPLRYQFGWTRRKEDIHKDFVQLASTFSCVKVPLTPKNFFLLQKSTSFPDIIS